jgi:hypothetical protein
VVTCAQDNGKKYNKNIFMAVVIYTEWAVVLYKVHKHVLKASARGKSLLNSRILWRKCSKNPCNYMNSISYRP